MWLSTPVDFDPFSLAEFLEMELLASGDPKLTISEVRDEFNSGAVPTEEDLEFALQEIEDRALRLGAVYPYRREGDAVAIMDVPGKYVYGALGLMSLTDTPFRIAKEYRRSDPVFDEIVAAAVVAALGDGAEAECFGWPPRNDRPGDFPGAVGWVAQKIGVGLRSNEAFSESADAGVDVIGWNRFPDHEVGFPLMLVQNTIQRNFVKKSKDVEPNDWRDWIRVKAVPMVGFAVPFAMPPNDPWWERSASNVTYMWDRRRIVWQLRRSRVDEWVGWSDLVAFVDRELSLIRGESPDADVATEQGAESAATPGIARPRKERQGVPMVGSNPATPTE